MQDWFQFAQRALAHIPSFTHKNHVMGIYIKFGLHNGHVEVYAVNSVTKERRSRSLKLFSEERCYPLETEADFWDGKAESFKTRLTKKIPISTAEADNQWLSELKERLERFAEAQDRHISPNDFFDAFLLHQQTEESKGLTLLEYAITFREMWRRNEVGEFTKPSGNYVVYDKFIHKLQGLYKSKEATWAVEARHFATLKINDITDNDITDWAKFIRKHNMGFKDSVAAFRATVYNYHRVQLGDDRYSLCSVNRFAPKRKNKGVNFTLSDKEMDELKRFDVGRLGRAERKQGKAQLMLDTALLMYAFASRPCDIISIRIESLSWDDGSNNYRWTYTPIKLVNQKEDSDTYLIDRIGVDIINKYKGGRTKGYLFPYTCNKKAGTVQERKVPINRISCAIGKLLQDIAEVCGWSVKHPTMYTLRKTAITNLCDRFEYGTVATLAKTSPREIRNVYQDDNRTAALAAKKLDIMST